MLSCSIGADVFELPPNRMYIDEKQLDNSQDCFRIHLGDNMWVEVSTLHRDSSGLFIFECYILRHPGTDEYKKVWNCPYCYRYWPEGTACQNSLCPDTY